MKFLSVSELIKEYRKQLDINQVDLAMGKISISTISLIEKNKLKITPVVAQILSDNFNKIAKSKDIPLSVTADELLIPDGERCRIWCQDEISRIDTCPYIIDIITEYKEILDVVTEYKLDDIISMINEKIANCYYLSRNFKKALEYYMACLGTYKKENNLYKTVETMKNIGNCYYYTDVEQSIDYYTNAYALIKDKKTDMEFHYLRSRILYDLALCHCYGLVNYKVSGDYLEKIDIANVKNTRHYINIMKLKAIVKINMGEYSSALEICEKLLTISDNHLEVCKPGIYNSIAICFKYLGQDEKAMQYFDLAINQMLKSNSVYMEHNVPRMLINASCIHLKNSKPDSSLRYAELAMDYAKTHKQSNCVVICYHMYYKIYKWLGNLEKCSELLDECEKFIDENYLSEEFRYKNKFLKIDLCLIREDCKVIKDLVENVLSEEDCFIGI